jgi:hypothetical protein
MSEYKKFHSWKSKCFGGVKETRLGVLWGVMIGAEKSLLIKPKLVMLTIYDDHFEQSCNKNCNFPSYWNLCHFTIQLISHSLNDSI